eukprot:360671-Chlamydomonas_euryale.AAC.2
MPSATPITHAVQKNASDSRREKMAKSFARNVAVCGQPSGCGALLLLPLASLAIPAPSTAPPSSSERPRGAVSPEMSRASAVPTASPASLWACARCFEVDLGAGVSRARDACAQPPVAGLEDAAPTQLAPPPLPMLPQVVPPSSAGAGAAAGVGASPASASPSGSGA